MTASSNSPKDGNTQHFAESRVELTRLLNLDLPPLKKTGRIFPEQADLSTIHKILDIACGTGEWVIATAKAYPHMQVVGIDRNTQLIDSARVQVRANGLENASFTVMDPLQPLDFPDNFFDLVNTRFITGALPTEAWPTFLQECLRVTRPGGILRLTESDLPITTSPAFEKFNGRISLAFYLAKYSFSPDGRLLSMTPMLSRLLQNAGCTDIHKAIYVTNFSAGMEAHDELAQDFSDTYRLVQPFLIEMGVTTQEEVDQVYQQMLAEMRSDSFCAVGFYLTVWGKKP